MTGRAALVAALLLLLRAGAAAQTSPFEGLWFGTASDSTTERMVVVESLVVRVREPCLPARAAQCEYRARAELYAPIGAARADTGPATLVAEYRGRGWRRVMVLSLRGPGQLDALVLTQFPGVRGRGGRVNEVERQVLRRGVAQMRPLSTIPQFPWPPPRPTAALRLRDGLVTLGAGDSLGAVFDRIRHALERVDVGWWSVYAIGDDGFAVVTRMEAIEPDGRPKPVPDRWLTPADRLPRRFGSIADYLRALFFARPGHYRIVAIAVTARPTGGFGAPLSADSAARLLRGGELDLPGWLRERPLERDGRCVALIYEFMRPSETDSARFVENSRATVVQHLTLAGLWTEEEIRR